MYQDIMKHLSMSQLVVVINIIIIIALVCLQQFISQFFYACVSKCCSPLFIPFPFLPHFFIFFSFLFSPAFLITFFFLNWFFLCLYLIPVFLVEVLSSPCLGDCMSLCNNSEADKIRCKRRNIPLSWWGQYRKVKSESKSKEKERRKDIEN